LRDRRRGPTLRRPLRGHARHRAARQRRLRLRPGIPPGRPRRRAHDGRAERGGEGRDQPPRPGCTRVPRMAQSGKPGGMRSIDAPAEPAAQSTTPSRPGTKTRAAGLSIASNASLIVLKIAAGAITGSIAILTEAVHSGIDLLASVVAFYSVRKADEPPDPNHPYGHVKVKGAERFDPITALLIAGAIVRSGVRIVTRSSRVLVDEALPAAELEVVRETIEAYDAPEVSGFHKLRARQAGSRRHIDLHVQFREGTTLERAHQVSHELQGATAARLRDADVLIHLEPETHPGLDHERPPVSGD